MCVYIYLYNMLCSQICRLFIAVFVSSGQQNDYRYYYYYICP